MSIRSRIAKLAGLLTLDDVQAIVPDLAARADHAEVAAAGENATADSQQLQAQALLAKAHQHRSRADRLTKAVTRIRKAAGS